MTTLSVPLHFGGVLKTWRKRRGVTQQQLADLSTVSVRAIRDLEIGRVARPRHDTVRLICDALGLTGRARADFQAAAIQLDDDRSWLHEPPAPPPAVFDGLIGRSAELAALDEALAGGQRLIGLIGLAGVGKTRLALEAVASWHAADRLPVLWSAYAGSRDDTVSAMIRTALSAETSATAKIGASDQLSALVRDRDTILVCDGYDGRDTSALDVEAVGSLLRACRGLRILVTSRSPLDPGGAWLLPVGPLGVPADGLDLDLLRDAASVRLLLRHVRRERPDFDLDAGNAAQVAAICRRLDGLPSALAAAAAWFLFYEPSALLDRIESDPFAVVADEAPELRSVIRAAVGGLPPEELALLDAVATVDSPFSIAAVAGVTGLGPGTAARLVRRLCLRGLLRAASEDGGREARFTVLSLVTDARKTAALLPEQPPIASLRHA
ncbi:transcriptional regulator with XRE-family HTH domain [Allocatelliglobosispora scoriae]|uniref:Transcriptional regulator with XRE-family HTH domain n=1 Tax=Allocatelliglobosispora scoriae TaxID=643052 RepID=A0A841C187_9ACTN|nr:helix-turn-helix domain-containing protein [Allocatelliglobosispora scoriae]MBB5872730.1 transcriptional regulator with XRE-family HTH domain [Allocatelliglobosispora scoriae]